MNRLFFIAVTVAFITAAQAQFTDYVYTGASSDPQQWDNEENWIVNGVVNGFPDGGATRVYINEAVTFTSGVPASLSRLYTGDGHVFLGSGLNMLHTSGGHGPILSVGAGGLDCGAGTITTAHGLTLIVYGDLKAGALGSGQGGSYTQYGGVWRIGNFQLGRQLSHTIGAWSFGQETATIQTHAHSERNVVFTGTPVFEDDVRPNWIFSAGQAGSTIYVDLQTNTLKGAQVTFKGGNKYPTSHYCLTNSMPGAKLDINGIVINSTYAPATFLALVDADIVLRGSGTVWDNRSTNNIAFNMRHETTVTFTPVGGSASIDSGSEDRDSTNYDPIDWENNFSFDTIKIDDGCEITLTGNANIGIGGNNALYARRLLGLGDGATVILNGHNIYLLEMPHNIVFDASAGGKVYFPKPRGTVMIVR